jgi:N-acyl-phosphatidylethanolamine-hydrolysing phospholipase D
MGPQRFTRTPVTAEDLPAVDAVVISHCHYDHMDAETLKTLRVRNESLGRGGLHVFVPLGNEEHLKGFGFDEEHIHCMDWWDVRKLGLSIPAADSGAEAIDMGVEITCTPAQHTANRSVNDRWKTLWASFAVRTLPNSTSPTSDLTGNGTISERGINGTGVYFSGDTAYRTVRHGEDEDAVPRNPEFKEIGRKFGGFELALLPIG